MNTALICGISGQDGAYLAKLLLEKGYNVWGSSRDAQISHFRNLEYLGIKDKVNLTSMTLTDFRSVLQVIVQVKPDDYVIATGESYSLEDFVRFAFEYFHLDWQQYVQTDSSLFRPTDLAIGRANPQKAWDKLGWKAKKTTPDVVKLMISAKIN